MLIPIAIGLFGFLIHWMGKAKQQGGAISGLGKFISDNAINLMYGLVSFLALMLVWYEYGIDMFGMEKGNFTGMTFFLGYASSSIVGTWIKSGRPNQLPEEKE